MRFFCDAPHVATQVNGTAAADTAESQCLRDQVALIFNGLGGNDKVTTVSCTGNVLTMGDGDDSTAASGSISGGNGADTLLGVNNSAGTGDTISGDVGKDFIRGLGGNDVLDGGSDRDVVDGNDGNDTVRGGTGRDVLNPGLGADVVEGGADIDEVSYEDRTVAVSVSLDGLANDGQASEGDRVTRMSRASSAASRATPSPVTPTRTTSRAATGATSSIHSAAPTSWTPGRGTTASRPATVQSTGSSAVSTTIRPWSTRSTSWSTARTFRRRAS